MIAYENKGLMISAVYCNKLAIASMSQEESTRYIYIYKHNINVHR